MAKRYKRPLPMWDNYPLEPRSTIVYAKDLPRISGRKQGNWITDTTEIERILCGFGYYYELTFERVSCIITFACGDVWAYYPGYFEKPRKQASGYDYVHYLGNLADIKVDNPNQLQLSFSN